MPWEVVQQLIQDTHPYEVFMVRQQVKQHTVLCTPCL
jgi:hypothetical protein